ncbi:MAG: NAD+ synthase [Nitrospirota bacterium]
MMRRLRIALAQINTTVGDLEGNTKKIIENIYEARKLGVDLIAFPELAITGYPPEDLLLNPQFIQDNLRCLRDIEKETQDITAVVGFVNRDNEIFNAAALMYNGQLKGAHHKMYLPNYGVFDEQRYFQEGCGYSVFVVRDVTVGVSICEDIWHPEGPVNIMALSGAEVIININASPYHAGKGKQREEMLSTRASDNTVIVAYVNMVGGQDELVFDGHSLIFDQGGELISRGKQFEEDMVIVDINADSVLRQRLHDPRRRKERLVFERECPPDVRRIPVSKTSDYSKKPQLSERKIPQMLLMEEIYHALLLGTKDYVRKNGFDNVLIGLSGGVDSSLVAAIAVDVLGADRVVGLLMPSPYTSKESIEDAFQVAKNLGIKVKEIPINEPFNKYLDTLATHFKGMIPDVTEENLQARIRGNILMAFSNKFGWLVLTTGNKSEMSVGYATLYGDMAGGFAVIKDVPKTMVYELCRYRNSTGKKAVIPERIIEKEPTAELRTGQKDSDTLPPYHILDPILKAYVEEDRSFEEMIDTGFAEETVRKVIHMVDRSEYKRRQSPPGIKITPRALGKDRRFPITNRYKSY